MCKKIVFPHNFEHKSRVYKTLNKFLTFFHESYVFIYALEKCVVGAQAYDKRLAKIFDGFMCYRLCSESLIYIQ